MPSLPHWRDGWSGPLGPACRTSSRGAESLPWRSQVAGDSGALHSQIHFSQSTPPFLSCSPIPCEKLFLKMGTSGSLLQASSVGVGSSTWNAWVPEALPPPHSPNPQAVN